MSHISRLNPSRNRREGRGRIWTKCDKLEGRLSDGRETLELSGLARSTEEHGTSFVSERASEENKKHGTSFVSERASEENKKCRRQILTRTPSQGKLQLTTCGWSAFVDYGVDTRGGDGLF